MTTHAAPAASPLRLGMLLMAAFTMMWMSNAAGSGHPVLTALGSFGVAGAAALFVGWFVTSRTTRSPQVRDTNDSPSAPTDMGTAHRRLGVAIAVEVVGILAIMAALGRTGHPELILPAIAMIVALHFLLVYRAYPHPMHVATAALGSVVAVTGMVLATGGADAGFVRGLVGLGMGLITLTYGVVFARGLGLLGGTL